MQHYELLYIISAKLTEEEIEPVNKQVTDLIEKNEGKITLKEGLGKKKLAYPINHNFHGYYELLEFDLTQEKLAEVDNKIKLTNEILRHQIIKKKVKTEEDVAREKEIMEKIEQKREEKEKKEEVKKEEPAKEKLKLEDLDKKLDEILDSDDII